MPKSKSPFKKNRSQPNQKNLKSSPFKSSKNHTENRSKNNSALAFESQTVSGILKRHPDGFGFLIVDRNELEDVFVPAQSMNTAMTNDKVSVKVEQERDGRYRGVVVKILERSQKKVAGKYSELNAEFGVIKDEGRGWGMDLKIPKLLDKSAQKGQLVAAIVRKFPDQGEFLGEIIEIIGDPASALNDVRRVIINQNIPDEFSAATLSEAKIFGSNPTEVDFKNRTDLRHLNLITIDGATAKDFDDAVYVEMKPAGFHLIVAIADVSHYVRPNTSIDREGYERGTSVYFPNFVVPMLPEALSNGLCSLIPHVPRLALVADMHFDFTGEMKTSSFYEAVIESKARVTYGEAQQVIDDENSLPKLSHVLENIMRCKDLAKLLMIKRFKEGSLDLEVPETELVIDGTGEPIDIIRSERLFAHRLIEELMLAANVAVAKFLSNKDIAAIYRVHEQPDPLKISLLQKHLEQFGSSMQMGNDKSPGSLQKKLSKALHEFEHKAESSIIHILTLRSMSQAKYTTENIGHFGLGFANYTHFTSPIRRYPDLIVHRLIKSQISLSNYSLVPEEDLQTAGTWLSACEQRSAKAERQIQSIKKSRFMKNRLGEEHEGIISSVTKFGVFVLLKQFNIDGLVRMEDLGPGPWQFDDENLKLISKRSGFSVKLGDPIAVQVSAVDVENGQINFTKVGVEKSELKFDETREKSFSKSKHSSRHQKMQSQSKGGRSSQPGRTPLTASPNKNKTFRRDSIQAAPIRASGAGSATSSPQSPPTPPSGQTQQQQIKPRYSSLSDYLDKNKGQRNEKQSFAKTTTKSSSGTTQDRKNSKKRSSSEDNPFGFRKARSQKSR